MKQSIITLRNSAKTALAAVILALSLSSCATSSKKEITAETSDKELIQRAQQAFNNRNYNLSHYYYTQLLQRYGNNTVDYIIGTFEIAHIAVKKKDYKTAVPLLNEVLEIYADTPTGDLPAAYRVLAQNDLKKIPESLRRSISASGKGNDYYENNDYGDTDFFGTIPDYGSYEDDSSSDDDYESGGNYEKGFRWY